MHYAGWRRAVVEERAARALRDKDEQIQKLLQQMSEQGGHAAAVAATATKKPGWSLFG